MGLCMWLIRQLSDRNPEGLDHIFPGLEVPSTLEKEVYNLRSTRWWLQSSYSIAAFCTSQVRMSRYVDAVLWSYKYCRSTSNRKYSASRNVGIDTCRNMSLTLFLRLSRSQVTILEHPRINLDFASFFSLRVGNLAINSRTILLFIHSGIKN